MTRKDPLRLTAGTLPDRMARGCDRYRYVLVALAAVLFAGTFTLRWRPGADSAALLVLARHFSETGQLRVLGGYHEGVMPGYPLLLALLGRLGDAATLAIAFQAAAFAAWVGLVFLWVCHAVDRRSAVVVATACALSARTIEASADVLPDMLFATTLIALLWWDRSQRHVVFRVLGSALCLGVLFSLRSVGALVAGAWLLSLVMPLDVKRVRRNRGPRWAPTFGVLVVGFLIVCVMPTLLHDAAALWRRLWTEGLGGIARTSWEAGASSFPEAVLGIDATPFAGPVITVLAALGVMLVWRRDRLAVLVVVCLALPWFLFIATPRYVVPVLPPLYLGLWLLVCEFQRRLGGPWAGLAWAALLAGNLVGVGRLIYEQRQSPFLENYRDGRFVATRAAADWLEQNTREGVRVLCDTREHAVLSYWSDRAVLTTVSTPAINAGRLLLIEPVAPEMDAALLESGWLLSEPVATFAAPEPRPAWTLREVIRPERDAESMPLAP